MWPLLAAAGPRILIPGFFLGPKLATMTDPVQIAQTLALSFLFVTFAFKIFSNEPWIGLIPGVAAWAYWNMLRDEANIEKYRYIDWTVTTPLMLFALLTVNKVALPTILGLIGLDLSMIAAGYFAVKESDETKKMGIFLVGCLVFLPILYVLSKLKMAKAAVGLTLATWILYPIMWYVGEERIVTKTTENVAFSVMDVVAKVGLVNLLHA